MADEVTPTDVINPGETETPSTPSGTDETTSQTPVADAAANVKETAEQSVPYSRFKEVNDKVKSYEAKLREMEAKIPQRPVDPQVQTVKETLKPILDEMGYVSKEELARQDQDRAVQQELSQLENKYNGTNGLPKFNRDSVVEFALKKQIGDLEAAYKTLHEKEYLNWHIQQAMSKTQGVKTEASDGSGASNPGTSTEDYKAAAMSGDKDALRTYLKRLSFGK